MYLKKCNFLIKRTNMNDTIYHHDYKNKTKNKPSSSNKCYTCKPRGTLKDHIISQTEHFTFNHDLFRRPIIIITTKLHYHTIYEIPNETKLQLFEDIRTFVEFWNLSDRYQLVINNGEAQTHHHFHAKIILNPTIANRMRRDHFTRINLEKTYNVN
jgi:hypothetical protein